MKSQAQSFQETGIYTLAYPTALREAVERAEKSWRAFLALPQEAKSLFAYSNGGAGFGYELKQGEGVAGDRKENFDLTVAGVDSLKGIIASTDDRVTATFLENAVTVLELLRPSVIKFAEDVEAEFGLQGFVDEVKASDVGYFVRFIHYFGNRQLGDETAAAHVDQSGFTFHLFESASGLQCLPYDKSGWVDMPVSAGETVIIPAMQMQRRDPCFRALAHRVVATKETQTDGRTSAVCFVQLQRTPRYDKDVGGRLQEKEPGFNYDMSAEEFNTMFK